MADTLNIALRSVLDQIDERFEVVLVDDGSKDESAKIAQQLAKKHANLNVISLPRDTNRKLGETRNISIRAAKGIYVLLHIDCDDITAPYISDFVTIFHHLEEAIGRDFLLSGRPIQMAKKPFLIELGPYRNIHRGEDRDLWSRLLKTGSYIPLNHRSLKTRLPKSKYERLRRSIYYTFDHLRNDFRGGLGLSSFIASELKYHRRFSLKMTILRLLICSFSWVKAKKDGPLDSSLGELSKPLTTEARMKYINSNGGTYPEILARLNLKPDWLALTDGGKDIFARGD